MLVIETELKDKSLLSACADHDSFELLVHRHFGKVYRFIQRRVGQSHAEQLASDVFAVAYEKRAAYTDQHDTALPWLYGIAHNTIANHRRAEQRQLRACESARSLVTHAPSIDGSVAARLDAVDLWPEMADALARLRDGERDALLLYAWFEMSYAEVADTLGIPVGSVRSRISRARRRLERDPVLRRMRGD